MQTKKPCSCVLFSKQYAFRRRMQFILSSDTDAFHTNIGRFYKYCGQFSPADSQKEEENARQKKKKRVPPASSITASSPLFCRMFRSFCHRISSDFFLRQNCR